MRADLAQKSKMLASSRFHRSVISVQRDNLIPLHAKAPTVTWVVHIDTLRRSMPSSTRFMACQRLLILTMRRESWWSRRQVLRQLHVVCSPRNEFSTQTPPID